MRRHPGSALPHFTSEPLTLPGASSVIEGYNANVPTGLTLHDVNLDSTAVTAQYANITLDRADLAPSGARVTVTTTDSGDPAPMRCAFPPFPGR